MTTVLEHDLIDTLALNTVARAVGVDVAKAKALLLGLVGLEQFERIVERAKGDRLRLMNAKTKREVESERYRRRVRKERA